MDGMGLLGVSWRHAPAATIARYTLPRESRSESLRALASVLEVDELVYLATCNRVEVLYARGADVSIAVRRRRFHAHFQRGLLGAEPAERVVRAWDGEGLVEHLYLLASGLDSARAGETEVTGQLRHAMSESLEAGLLGDALRPLLDETFRIAKRVRPVTEGRIGRTSLADVALDLVRARLAERRGAVALVGVSPMTERCGIALRSEGVPLVVVNRTAANATSFAEQVGAELRTLDEFRAAPSTVSAIVLATGATEPVFDRAALKHIASAEAPLIVDLGVPSNVRAEDARDAGLPYIDLERVTRAADDNREAAMQELGVARAMIDDALDARRRRRWEALVDPAIVELRRRFSARAESEVERALRQELAGLGPEEREAVRRLSDGLARHLAHVPSRGLRDLAGLAGPEAAAAFLGTAAPDLAADVRARARTQGDSRGYATWAEFA